MRGIKSKSACELYLSVFKEQLGLILLVPNHHERRNPQRNQQAVKRYSPYSTWKQQLE